MKKKMYENPQLRLKDIHMISLLCSSHEGSIEVLGKKRDATEEDKGQTTDYGSLW